MNEHSPPFTDAEMDTARQTDLPDLLSSFGYQVKPKGNYHTLAEMPHIIIKRRSSYYDNYARAWGDAITFLETHHNMDFKQAVHHPTAFSGPVHLRVDGAAFCILSKFQFKRRNEQC